MNGRHLFFCKAPPAMLSVDLATRVEDGRVLSDEVRLDDYLDDLEAERNEVIMKLRRIEKRLVRYGRLKQESLPRRMR